MVPQATTFLNLEKNDEIMSKNQFTGTAIQPQRNRKCCQFNKDQFCTCVGIGKCHETDRCKKYEIVETNVRKV